MKNFKLIAGFFILFGIAKEYVNASKQLLTFFDPGIIFICLLFLILCTFLIGGRFSKEKLSFKSFQFLKYYLILFFVFLMIAFLCLLSFRFTPEIVSVNGIDVDIAEFMNGTQRIIPDDNQRKDYCVCVVTKITADKDLVAKYKSELENGKLSSIILEMQNGPLAYKYNLNACMSNTDITWTPDFEKGIRSSLMKNIRQSGIAQTHDTTKYCDCLMKELKKLPAKEITQQEFGQSQTYLTLDSVCIGKSKH